jgi:hypothetical protein
MEVETNSQNKSKGGSSKSSKISKKKSADIISDIDISELELLANKKKMNKKSEELSINKENSSNDPIIKEKSKQKDPTSVKKQSYRRSYSSTDSSDDRYRTRKLNKENKSESTRKEKMDLLLKLTTLINNNHGKYSSKMSMDNTLDEIKGDFTRIKSAADNEKMVKFCKHGLVMGIKGLEYMNTSYDPLGVDLDGWGESMAYNMETAEYDEVLSELYEKYKGTGTMSPEVKLLMMIVMSGAMFSFTKRASKDPEMLGNILGSFMPKMGGGVAPQRREQSQMPQQNYAPPRQEPVQNSYSNSRQQHNQQVPQQFQQQFMVPGFSPLAGNNDQVSEDSDDIPSKIRGPGNFDSPDSVHIENIMRQMQQKKQQKQQNDIEKMINEKVNEKVKADTDSDIRNINVKPKRGRPANKKKTVLRI